MPLYAAEPIRQGNTTHGFDALREFYEIQDEKRRDQLKKDAQEFKALQTIAKVRGWAEPDAMTISDLGSLKGLVEGNIAKEKAEQVNKELAIRKIAAERERQYAKSNLGRLITERDELAAAGKLTPELEQQFKDAIANETTGQKQFNLEAQRQQNRMSRDQARADFTARNQKAIAELRNQFVIEAEQRKAAAGGNPRFILTDKDKLLMDAELESVLKYADPDELPGIIEGINKKYSALAIQPKAAPAPEAPAHPNADLKKQEATLEKVLIEKDGKTFRIPAGQLDEALKQGYTQPK